MNKESKPTQLTIPNLLPHLEYYNLSKLILKNPSEITSQVFAADTAIGYHFYFKDLFEVYRGILMCNKDWIYGLKIHKNPIYNKHNLDKQQIIQLFQLCQ